MTMIAQRMRRTLPPPVMEARRWIENVSFPADRPLINLSQAAPVEPPPERLRLAMAEMILSEDDTHLYGPVLGLPALRREIAAQWSASYGGDIGSSDVAITPGCNMAFCTAIATIASSGDAVMLPTPWYFNHKMWLDMNGIETVGVPCDARMLPDIESARRLISARVKAIVLVTPNNPTGAEYPSELVAEFAALAKASGVTLIIDETYRDFDSRDTPPHALFEDKDWRDHIVHLYSFSKSFRLTGHRVGALVAGPEILCEAEKFLDTTVICATQLGQKAALWAMRNLSRWLVEERAEILRRRSAAIAAFDRLEGWRLLSCGAYFAYVEHPFDMESHDVARRLVAEAGVLLLPGTMFGATRIDGGDGGPERQLRIAFANVAPEGLDILAERLARFRPAPLASPAVTA